MSEVSARKRGTKWEYYFVGARISNQRKKISKSGFATKKEAVEAGNNPMVGATVACAVAVEQSAK